jgi:hypothetical protein
VEEIQGTEESEKVRKMINLKTRIIGIDAVDIVRASPCIRDVAAGSLSKKFFPDCRARCRRSRAAGGAQEKFWRGAQNLESARCRGRIGYSSSYDYSLKKQNKLMKGGK